MLDSGIHLTRNGISTSISSRRQYWFLIIKMQVKTFLKVKKQLKMLFKQCDSSQYDNCANKEKQEEFFKQPLNTFFLIIYMQQFITKLKDQKQYLYKSFLFQIRKLLQAFNQYQKQQNQLQIQVSFQNKQKIKILLMIFQLHHNNQLRMKFWKYIILDYSQLEEIVYLKSYKLFILNQERFLQMQVLSYLHL
ncbi:unnamed protein product [Paramecium pentaurelia]|uniref:Uncharacterized protein n=1 Tax=Paramecium pentaurelia TaxID=43138 RepID=A0A8S1YNA8_9CILI|nr:unnamed protein product [Paramecium pentaurelia]